MSSSNRISRRIHLTRDHIADLDKDQLVAKWYMQEAYINQLESVAQELSEQANSLQHELQANEMRYKKRLNNVGTKLSLRDKKLAQSQGKFRQVTHSPNLVSKCTDNTDTDDEPIVTLDKPISNKNLIKRNQVQQHLARLAPFLRHKNNTQINTTKQIESSKLSFIKSLKKHNQITPPPYDGQLSSLYNTKDSLLRNLASYRLTSGYLESGSSITDLRYTHNICPNDYICLPDLIGTCMDKDCLYQHKSTYFMSDIEKLADVLSYKPSLTGFKVDQSLSREENDSKCRLKLKQYAARLLAKNSDKSIDTIAHNLVKYIRANKSEHKLLMTTRKLPKTSHLACNTLSTNNLKSDKLSSDNKEK